MHIYISIFTHTCIYNSCSYETTVTIACAFVKSLDKTKIIPDIYINIAFTPHITFEKYLKLQDVYNYKFLTKVKLNYV